MATRTMNTLLHVFEGYSGLYEAAPSDEVRAALVRILDIYAAKIYSPEMHRQLVFFDHDYNSLIDLYSYGHDIESSWLIDWGTRLLGDEKLTAGIEKVDSDLARHIYEIAYPTTARGISQHRRRAWRWLCLEPLALSLI